MGENKNIILFDGVCNLCNSFVQFVIKRDKKAIYRFASLQSEIGQKILRENHLSTDKMTSVVLVQENKVWIKSDAALHIAFGLDGGWKFCRFLLVFPRFFRDFIYDIVAKSRYRIFGKRDECMLPSAELKSRFL